VKPNYIVIHHSATKDSGTVSWGAIREYHKRAKGWSDIGYHFGIEWMGDRDEVLLGRMPDQPGAHCIGLNSNSIGICCVGNFDELDPPEEQWQLCLQVVRWLMGIYRIPTERVIGHREWAKDGRSCPGKRWDMGAFRTLI